MHLEDSKPFPIKIITPFRNALGSSISIYVRSQNGLFGFTDLGISIDMVLQNHFDLLICNKSKINQITQFYENAFNFHFVELFSYLVSPKSLCESNFFKHFLQNELDLINLIKISINKN